MGLHLDTFYGYCAMLYEPHSKTPSKRKKSQTNKPHPLHTCGILRLLSKNHRDQRAYENLNSEHFLWTFSVTMYSNHLFGVLFETSVKKRNNQQLKRSFFHKSEKKIAFRAFQCRSVMACCIFYGWIVWIDLKITDNNVEFSNGCLVLLHTE